MCINSPSSLTVLGSRACGLQGGLAGACAHRLTDKGRACDALFGLRRSEWGPSAACLPFLLYPYPLGPESCPSANSSSFLIPKASLFTPVLPAACTVTLHWHVRMSICRWLPNNSNQCTMHYSILPPQPQPHPQTSALRVMFDWSGIGKIWLLRRKGQEAKSWLNNEIWSKVTSLTL